MTERGESDGLRIFPSQGGWRWSLVDRTGASLVDGATWHDSPDGARQEAIMAIRSLLRADLPGTDLEIARHLARRTTDQRDAIAETATEFLREFAH